MTPTEKQYQKVCETALQCVPDLLSNCHKALDEYQAGSITVREYMDIIMPYKHLRDALYHTGYLPEDHDDGEI